jgi:endonuclease-3
MATSGLVEPSFRLTRSQKKQLLEDVIKRLRAACPDPKTELIFHTPYQLLVSVVLSAQTTDKMVNRCMQPLYDDQKQAFTPELVTSWGEKKLLGFIKSIGLAPTKAKNITRLSQLLLEHHQGEVPLSRGDLEALPGVGRKTANVVLAELTGAPTLGVDTHVLRVTRRLGLHHETLAASAERELLKIIPKNYLPKAHHWFILHGRYTCKAQKPLCETCVLNDICPMLVANAGLYRKHARGVEAPTAPAAPKASGASKDRRAAAKN